MHSIDIFLAKYLIVLLVGAAGLYWLFLAKGHKWYMAVFGIVVAVVAFLLDKVGGSLFYDTRPFAVDHTSPLVHHVADNGFPSEHMLVAAIVAAAVLAVSRKWGVGFAAAALLVGVGRVAVHVHHVTDIAGSIVFVGVGYLAAWYATPFILGRLRAKHTPTVPKA